MNIRAKRKAAQETSPQPNAGRGVLRAFRCRFNKVREQPDQQQAEQYKCNHVAEHIENARHDPLPHRRRPDNADRVSNRLNALDAGRYAVWEVDFEAADIL